MREITETVQHMVFAAGAEDAHGNPTEAWGEPEPVGVWAFDPGSSEEPRLPGQNREIVQPTIYSPPDVVFGALDKVIARGKTYQVEGGTREWVSARFSGNVTPLRYVEG